MGGSYFRESEDRQGFVFIELELPFHISRIDPRPRTSAPREYYFERASTVTGICYVVIVCSFFYSRSPTLYFLCLKSTLCNIFTNPQISILRAHVFLNKDI